MKRLLSALFAASLSLLVSVALVDAAATYNNTVTGAQTASSQSGGIALNLNASGDLPGMISLSITHEGGNVSGGSWTMSVLPPNADATSSESGKLSGKLTGGTLTLDANGIVTAASSVQLTVENGTDQHAAVNGGSGTLSLSADPENSTKLVGTLALNF
jgi:hypothetical protein